MYGCTSAIVVRQLPHGSRRVDSPPKEKWMNRYHIAQVNIGRIKAPLESPVELRAEVYETGLARHVDDRGPSAAATALSLAIGRRALLASPVEDGSRPWMR